jgi:hypothetical protein
MDNLDDGNTAAQNQDLRLGISFSGPCFGGEDR